MREVQAIVAFASRIPDASKPPQRDQRGQRGSMEKPQSDAETANSLTTVLISLLSGSPIVKQSCEVKVDFGVCKQTRDDESRGGSD